jgi:hypothetical protein
VCVCVCLCVCVCVFYVVVRIKASKDFVTTEETKSALYSTAVFIEIRNNLHPLGSSLCEVKKCPDATNKEGVPSFVPTPQRQSPL